MSLPAKSAAMPQVEPATPWRVLLADDHEMVRETLSQVLSRLDPALEVHQAATVAEALAELRANPGYALLLLDYHMPGMKGAKTVAEVKRELPNLAIGIITGYASNAEIAPFIAAGAIGVFSKTVSGPSLLLALKQAMARRAEVPWRVDLIGEDPTRPKDEAPGRADAAPDLSDREKQVLSYVVTGSPNKEIARKLGLSEVTITIHVATLCRKFSAGSRTQLATAAMAAGIRPASA